MKRFVFLLMCVLVTTVAFGAEPQEIIDNTLDYMKTQFSFGVKGNLVEAIDYSLSDVFETDDGDVILLYDINNHLDATFKTRVGFVVNEESNVIKMVLFDDNFAIFLK